jgi:hypothetical protein
MVDIHTSSPAALAASAAEGSGTTLEQTASSDNSFVPEDWPPGEKGSEQ